MEVSPWIPITSLAPSLGLVFEMTSTAPPVRTHAARVEVVKANVVFGGAPVDNHVSHSEIRAATSFVRAIRQSTPASVLSIASESPLFMLILIVIDIGPRNRLLGWLAPRAASRAPGAVARRPRASAPK